MCASQGRHRNVAHAQCQIGFCCLVCGVCDLKWEIVFGGAEACAQHEPSLSAEFRTVTILKLWCICQCGLHDPWYMHPAPCGIWYLVKVASTHLWSALVAYFKYLWSALVAYFEVNSYEVPLLHILNTSQTCHSRCSIGWATKKHRKWHTTLFNFPCYL
jgi:hypothetical protein